MPRRRLLQGYLLSSAGVDLRRDNVLVAGPLKFVKQIGRTRWDEYRLASPKPLLSEEQTTISGTYDYLVLCRRSGSRLLLLAESLRIIESLLRLEASANKDLRLRRLRIAVQGLVELIAANPGRFLLSRVDALIPAYGQALRSVSFYGDDVSEAKLFREQLPMLQCYGCGLREAANRREVLRLVSRGVVSFQYDGVASRILEVEQALHFVSHNGFLDFDSEEMS